MKQITHHRHRLPVVPTLGRRPGRHRCKPRLGGGLLDDVHDNGLRLDLNVNDLLVDELHGCGAGSRGRPANGVRLRRRDMRDASVGRRRHSDGGRWHGVCVVLCVRNGLELGSDRGLGDDKGRKMLLLDRKVLQKKSCQRKLLSIEGQEEKRER
jgi:hypothetical protein